MKKYFYFAAVVLALTSCKKDENEEQTPTTPQTPVTMGFYALNEGAFNANNASLSFIVSEQEIQSDPYFDANGVPLGDVLQSYVSHGSKGFAVLNGSNKIEVFNKSNWQNITTIEGINYPRYIVDGGNGRLYLSAGSMAGSVHVINPETHAIETSIAVGNGPERLLVHGGKLFVCNSGGWIEDNTVSVIDISTNTVISTIAVGDRPNDIDVDDQGNVWVLCSGKVVYGVWPEILEETEARLVSINSSTNEVISNSVVGTLGDHPKHMEVENNVIYYINDELYSFNTVSGELPGSIFLNGNYNSIDIRNGQDIWLTSIPNFTTSSTLFQYNFEGALIHQWTAGIGTNGVVFF